MYLRVHAPLVCLPRTSLIRLLLLYKTVKQFPSSQVQELIQVIRFYSDKRDQVPEILTIITYV